MVNTRTEKATGVDPLDFNSKELGHGKNLNTTQIIKKKLEKWKTSSYHHFTWPSCKNNQHNWTTAIILKNPSQN